jgi:hypothetical protein
MRPSSDGVRVCSSYRFRALGCFCFLGRASAGSSNVATHYRRNKNGGEAFFHVRLPFPQSSSASRFTAGASGFLNLSQSGFLCLQASAV